MRLYRSALYRSAAPRLLRFSAPIHVRLYRLFRGRFVDRVSMGFMPLLLLTTVGRKTGRPRTQPVGFIRDGTSFLIVGSNGGLRNDPGWVLNLRARPEVEVQIAADRMSLRAEILSGDERERAWREITTRYPFFADYQSAIRRRIPVVRLAPRST